MKRDLGLNRTVCVSQGTFAGILIGLAQLNCSELKLKRLCCRHGYRHTSQWLMDLLFLLPSFRDPKQVFLV